MRNLGSLGPLNTLIPCSRSLEIVGELNHLVLQVENPCLAAYGLG
jgi:hypothetical protein